MLILVSINLSAPWGRRRVDRKGSEDSKTYNRMRLACSRRREPWPEFDTNCFRVGGRVIAPLSFPWN